MIRTMKFSLSLVLAALLSNATANAQQNEDPNLQHFYHGRQHWDVTQDGPIVKVHGQPAAGNGGMDGSLPAGRPGLPQAGWTPYAPANSPGLSTSLPKVINGVPPKQVPKPTGATGLKGKSGALIAGRNKGHTQTPGSNVAKTYKPYSTYASPEAVSAVGADGTSSATKVSGSLMNQPQTAPRSALHWSHAH
jgi:hypothetical protein